MKTETILDTSVVIALLTSTEEENPQVWKMFDQSAKIGRLVMSADVYLELAWRSVQGYLRDQSLVDLSELCFHGKIEVQPMPSELIPTQAKVKARLLEEQSHLMSWQDIYDEYENTRLVDAVASTAVLAATQLMRVMTTDARFPKIGLSSEVPVFLDVPAHELKTVPEQSLDDLLQEHQHEQRRQRR